MLNNRFFLLAITTVIVVVCAFTVVQLRAPQKAKDKELLFPQLADKMHQIEGMRLDGYKKSISLSRQGDAWGIDDFDGYPALPEKVNAAILGLSELRILAPKTKQARLYHRLGVEGPELEDSSSILLSLTGEEAKPVLSVIIGKPRRSQADESNPGFYIRMPDEEQSYLVEGVVNVSAEKTDWLNRQLLDFPADSIANVIVEHSDGDKYRLFRESPGQENFDLNDIPYGRKSAPSVILNRYGRILQDVQISGARNTNNLSVAAEHIKVELETFDGIKTLMTVFLDNDTAYSSFNFSYSPNQYAKSNEESTISPEKINEFVAGLNQQVNGWYFEIPDFKYDIVKLRSDKLVRDDYSKQEDNNDESSISATEPLPVTE